VDGDLHKFLKTNSRTSVCDGEYSARRSSLRGITFADQISGQSSGAHRCLHRLALRTEFYRGSLQNVLQSVALAIFRQA
jgi:hypothetical protein